MICIEPNIARFPVGLGKLLGIYGIVDECRLG